MYNKQRNATEGVHVRALVILYIMCHIGQYSVFCGQWASHHKSTPRLLSVDTLQIQPALK